MYVRIALVILSCFGEKIALANLQDFKECMDHRLPLLQLLPPGDIRPRWNTYKAPSFSIAVKPKTEVEISVVVREALTLPVQPTIF